MHVDNKGGARREEGRRGESRRRSARSPTRKTGETDRGQEQEGTGGKGSGCCRKLLALQVGGVGVMLAGHLGRGRRDRGLRGGAWKHDIVSCKHQQVDRGTFFRNSLNSLSKLFKLFKLSKLSKLSKLLLSTGLRLVAREWGRVEGRGEKNRTNRTNMRAGSRKRVRSG
eukprot:753712-Hanusia_phi.AAC.6